jgi:hypothetical protein
MSQADLSKATDSPFDQIFFSVNRSRAIISALISLNDAQHRGKVAYVPTPEQIDDLFFQIDNNLKDIQRAAKEWQSFPE